MMKTKIEHHPVLSVRRKRSIFIVTTIMLVALALCACGTEPRSIELFSTVECYIDSNPTGDLQDSVTGMAADGQTFLVMRNHLPYIFKNGVYTPITLDTDNSWTMYGFEKELERLLGSITAGATASEMLEARAVFESYSLYDPECFYKFLQLYTDYREDALLQISTAYSISPGAVDDGHMIVSTGWGYRYLLNLEDGTLCGNGQVCSSLGGKVMYTEGCRVYEVDIESGEVLDVIDMSEYTNLEDISEGENITARYLPDGSVCAIVREAGLDRENGQRCEMITVNSAGGHSNYYLGYMFLNYDPDTIIYADTGHVIAFSTDFGQPVMVNIKTGEVSLLSLREDFVVVAGEINRETFKKTENPPCFFDYYADGQSFIFKNSYDGNFYLFRPSDMTTALMVDFSETDVSAQSAYWASDTMYSNHKDTFYLGSSGVLKIVAVKKK